MTGKNPMSWMAIRGHGETLRKAVQDAGVEVIGEGGVEALAAFLEGAESLKEPWAMVCLIGQDLLAQLVSSWDAAFAGEAEGGKPLTIATDDRLTSSLVKMVKAKVAEEGVCLLDLWEFGVSAKTVQLVAERAGLSVAVGLKAVFTSKES